MPSFDKTHEMDVEEVKAQTDKAILCLFETGEEAWIPTSQIDDSSEVQEKGDTGALVMSEFIARAKGLL